MSNLIDYFYKGQHEGNKRYHDLLRDRYQNRTTELLLAQAELDLDGKQRTHEDEVKRALAQARDLAHKHDYDRDKRERMRPYDYYETASNHYANTAHNLNRGQESEQQMRYRNAFSNINFDTAQTDAQSKNIEAKSRYKDAKTGLTLSEIQHNAVKENQRDIQELTSGTMKSSAKLGTMQNHHEIDLAKVEQAKTDINLKLARHSQGDLAKSEKYLQDIIDSPLYSDHYKLAATEKMGELKKQKSEWQAPKPPPAEFISWVNKSPREAAARLGITLERVDEEGNFYLTLLDGTNYKMNGRSFFYYLAQAYGYQVDEKQQNSVAFPRQLQNQVEPPFPYFQHVKQQRGE